jgi:NitT/TauT family transport system substrate-binding protein
MKRSQWGMIIIAVVVLGFLAWYGLSQQKQSSSGEGALKISINPWIGNTIFWVAQEKGLFAQEGVTIEFVSADDTATGKQLLQTGKVDAYYLTPEAVVVLSDAGTKVKVFAGTDLSFGADGVVATKEITSIADLKGKMVAFEVGSPSHFLLSSLLKEKGLTTNDFTVINNLASDAGAAFLAGKVDAAVTWEPYLTSATERKGGHLLASSKDFPLVYDMFIFRADRAAEHTKDVKAMYKAIFAAQTWIEAHRTEAAEIAAKQLSITPAEALEQMKGVHWLSYQESLDKLASGKFSVKSSIQTASDLWLELGFIEKNVDASEIVDDQILKTLYQ